MIESMVVVKGLGVQLSTTRGISTALPSVFHTVHSSNQEDRKGEKDGGRSATRFAISTSNLFIPLDSISDIVINEGIYGWRIIYYLVIIQTQGKEEVKLRIAFPVRPPFFPCFDEAD